MSQLANDLPCVRHCWRVNGQNNIVNNVSVDDSTAENAIIASNVHFNPISYLCVPSRFYWNSDCADAGIFDLRCISRQSSNVTVQWDIPVDQQPGTYRIMVSGNAQAFNGTFLLIFGGILRTLWPKLWSQLWVYTKRNVGYGWSVLKALPLLLMHAHLIGVWLRPTGVTLQNALLCEPERPIKIEENIAEMLFSQNNINLKGYNSN